MLSARRIRIRSDGGEKMRDPKRIPKMLKLIEGIWEANPDLRLCQLIANVIPDDIYYVEDDQLERALKIYEHINKEIS